MYYGPPEAVGKQSRAKLLLHSMNPDGDQLWQLQLRYPRIIHSEFMTHRVFSRNASSSRAIPIERVIEAVRTDTAMPVEFGGNKPGMQATPGDLEAQVEIPSHLRGVFHSWSVREAKGQAVFNDDGAWTDPRTAWRFSAWLMSLMQEEYGKAGFHKQIANRLTEFAQYISVVMSTTDLENFLVLRDHEMADPTIRDLAVQIRRACESSVPQLLQWGEWALPYTNETTLAMNDLVKVSTARCARVSYNRHNGEPNSYDADFKLYSKLADNLPPHFSPLEHPAIAIRGQYANYKGFASHRWQVERGIVIGRA